MAAVEGKVHPSSCKTLDDTDFLQSADKQFKLLTETRRHVLVMYC